MGMNFEGPSPVTFGKVIPSSGAGATEPWVLFVHFAKGENRERFLAIKIPPSLLEPDYLDQARAFANNLADGLDTKSQTPMAAPELALHGPSSNDGKGD